MSFCCGASMLGSRGTMFHQQSYIHHVPVLYCIVCQRVEVHYIIREDYELLAEFSSNDGAVDVDFNDYIDCSYEVLLENCVNHEDEDTHVIIYNQIDMALDLLNFAEQIDDKGWKYALKRRLQLLNSRRNMLHR
ncbi:hypothetical protein ACFSTH_15475 [Paenibacillus yanchengensis]|uniref:IDEAL domain-containing protein n=1 Tax=Paenibacillus yanchengensis TaxID=2035833 RepID=A0ABW4YFW3_9BACL